MTIGGVPPLINKLWFINPGLTLTLIQSHISIRKIPQFWRRFDEIRNVSWEKCPIFGFSGRWTLLSSPKHGKFYWNSILQFPYLEVMLYIPCISIHFSHLWPFKQPMKPHRYPMARMPKQVKMPTALSGTAWFVPRFLSGTEWYEGFFRSVSPAQDFEEVGNCTTTITYYIYNYIIIYTITTQKMTDWCSISPWKKCIELFRKGQWINESPWKIFLWWSPWNSMVISDLQSRDFPLDPLVPGLTNPRDTAVLPCRHFCVCYVPWPFRRWWIDPVDMDIEWKWMATI